MEVLVLWDKRGREKEGGLELVCLALGEKFFCKLLYALIRRVRIGWLIISQYQLALKFLDIIF
jgi:hypothetical protein